MRIAFKDEESMRKWVKHPTTSVIRKYFASEASSVKCIENGVTTGIFCTKKLDILVGIPYWKGCHYVHFSQTKNSACPCWPTLVKGRHYVYFYKKLGVLVGLPYWKWRHYVQFCKWNCMSLLVYPSERASLCAFFAKENCVSLLAYPIEKGVTMCILCTKTCMFLLDYLIKSGVTMCIFCKQLLAYSVAKDVTMCIFAKENCVSLLA